MRDWKDILYDKIIKNEMTKLKLQNEPFFEYDGVGVSMVAECSGDYTVLSTDVKFEDDWREYSFVSCDSSKSVLIIEKKFTYTNEY